VGASDYVPHTIWARKFLQKQGYAIKKNTFYQDNQSAIRFEKNGRKLCGLNSRHIDIRYFFIKDRLEIEWFNVDIVPRNKCWRISSRSHYRATFFEGFGRLSWDASTFTL
jgi:hypothetical protein